jgi:hypothetical protein
VRRILSRRLAIDIAFKLIRGVTVTETGICVSDTGPGVGAVSRDINLVDVTVNQRLGAVPLLRTRDHTHSVEQNSTDAGTRVCDRGLGSRYLLYATLSHNLDRVRKCTHADAL